MPSVGLYRMVWIPSAIALVSMIALFSQQPASIKEPGEMKPYTNEDRTISFDKPSDWKVGGLSMRAISSSIVLQPERNISLEISSDLSGSLVADINRSSNAQANALASMIPGGQDANRQMKSPLESAHEADGKAMQKLFQSKEYSEQPAQPATIGGKEALASDFAFKEAGFLGSVEMAGKRITVLGRDRKYSISYQYPKSAEEKIRPVFEKIVESLKLEQGG